MGAWGPGIFADDEAADVRLDFKLYIADRQDIADASKAIAADYGASFDDPGQHTAFWLALALTQWSAGWLDLRVLEAALFVIDSGADLAKWGENPLRSRRAAALRAARSKLISEPPAPRVYPRPWPTQLADFRVGEVLGQRLANGRLAVMKVIGFRPTHSLKVRGPAVRLQHWLKSEMPTPQEAAGLDYLRHPLAPNRVQTEGAYVLTSPRAKPLDSQVFLRPNIIVELRPGEQRTSYRSVSTWEDSTIDDVFSAAVERYWEDPGLGASAWPPWYDPATLKRIR